MSLTKQQLEALNNNSFPNNTTGYITPEILRTYNDAIIVNTVNQDVYTTDSASFDNRINNIVIEDLGFVTTASFNEYTQSVNNEFNTLVTTASFNQFSQSYVSDSSSFNNRIDNLNIDTSSFATTGSNTFAGTQTISGSNGVLIYGGTDSAPDYTLAEIHAVDDQPWLERFYNDTFSTSSSVMSYFAWNDGRFIFHNDSTASIGIGVNGFNNPELLVYEDSVSIKNDLLVSGTLKPNQIDVSSGSIIETTGSYIATFTSGGILTYDNYQNVATALQPYIQTGSAIDTASFATTSSLNSLSQSLYFTDTTQSENIANNSASIGLLQTFSGSQYKNDSSSFNSRIIAATNEGQFATTGSNTFVGQQTLTDVDKLNQITLGQQSGSLVLFGKGFTSSSLSNITASSATLGANIIFKNNNSTAQTEISSSGNILVNPLAPTAGFKRFIGSSLNTNLTGGNIAINPNVIPQISASMAFPISMAANYFNIGISMRGPVSSSQWSFSNNIINQVLNIGSSAANNAQGIVSGLNFTSNITVNSINVTAPITLLTQSPIISANMIAGGGGNQLNMYSSSANVINNVLGGLIINNSASGSPLAIANGVNSITITNNFSTGQNNLITATGSYDDNDISGVTTLRGVGFSQIFGQNVNINLSQIPTGSNSLNTTTIMGSNLAVTGSNPHPGIGANYSMGSAFFGRWNVNSGNKAKSAETIFAVGTGTPTERKTGFLIDSGSNTFVEGSLNVSGSTSTTGSITIQSGSGDLYIYGHKMFNYGVFQNNTTLSGSANVSQSFQLDTTDEASGVSIVNGSQITFANAGVYNIQFSAQVTNGAGSANINIWFKKNGVNIPESNTRLSLQSNSNYIPAWNFVKTFAAGDYAEIVWQADTNNVTIPTVPASGNYPIAPSIIVTATQVR